MTPSLNEIIFDILLQARAGNVVSTEKISREQIKFWILNERSTFIRNELNKSRSIDPYLIQDLGCLELVAVDTAECCSVETDCTFYRTKERIPSTVELHHKSLITRVGPVDKLAKKFDIIPYERVAYEVKGYNKFTRDGIKVFQMNDGGYIYLAIRNGNTKANLIEHINVQGVFENPEDAAKFKHCDGNPCYTEDSSFPIKRWMITSLTSKILKEKFGIINQTLTDNTSDGAHNPTRT